MPLCGRTEGGPGLTQREEIDDVRADSTDGLDWSKLERVTVKIADIGNATPIENHFSDDIQTRQYRSPEVIMGSKWDETADIWSVGCMVRRRRGRVQSV